MEIIIQIWITLLVLAMVYCFYMLYKNHLEMIEISKTLIRNNKVYEYRIDLLKRIGVDRFKKLASYDEMLKSNKQLIDSNWLNDI